MEATRIDCGTLWRFLFGSRQAIFDLAMSREAIWVGLLFVLSAGLAREYDVEYLIAEPWHVLLPLAASLISSLVLFALVYAVAWCRGVRGKNFLAGYRVFLTLFWMTAPLAWLYAIPVERLMTAPASVSANLWLLGIVSLWRVLLISRVVAVLYECRFLAALFVVMLFADTLALVVLLLTPLPIFNLMGGIHLSESEQIIQGTSFLVGLLGVLSWPVWFFGTLAVASPVGSDRPWQYALANGQSQNGKPIARSLWALAAVAILCGIAVLPLTQPQQRNRHRVESLLTSGQLDEAIREMSALRRLDFPPHWEPPPRIGYGERKPPLEDVLGAVLAAKDVAPWVKTAFVDKAITNVRGFRHSVYSPVRLRRMNDEVLASYVELLESVPQGRELARTHASEIRTELSKMYEQWPEFADQYPALTETRRRLLERLLRLGEDARVGVWLIFRPEIVYVSRNVAAEKCA